MIGFSSTPHDCACKKQKVRKEMIAGETDDQHVALKSPVHESNVWAILTVVLRCLNGVCMDIVRRTGDFLNEKKESSSFSKHSSNVRFVLLLYLIRTCPLQSGVIYCGCNILVRYQKDSNTEGAATGREVGVVTRVWRLGEPSIEPSDANCTAPVVCVIFQHQANGDVIGTEM